MFNAEEYEPAEEHGREEYAHPAQTMRASALDRDRAAELVYDLLAERGAFA